MNLSEAIPISISSTSTKSPTHSASKILGSGRLTGKPEHCRFFACLVPAKQADKPESRQWV
jgi:hypothetical protein